MLLNLNCVSSSILKSTSLLESFKKKRVRIKTRKMINKDKAENDISLPISIG